MIPGASRTRRVVGPLMRQPVTDYVRQHEGLAWQRPGGGTEGRHFRSVTRPSISESSGVQFGLWNWPSAETMHLSQIPCLRLLALDTRFDSAFMCKECVTVSAQKISLLRTKSPMRLLHWRGGSFARVSR